MMPKKLKGTLGDFQHLFCRKTPKKLKRGPFGEFFPKKSPAMPKKLKGGSLWSRPELYVTRETFLVHFIGPTGTI